jgi:hypothetical protein
LLLLNINAIVKLLADFYIGGKNMDETDIRERIKSIVERESDEQFLTCLLFFAEQLQEAQCTLTAFEALKGTSPP